LQSLIPIFPWLTLAFTIPIIPAVIIITFFVLLLMLPTFKRFTSTKQEPTTTRSYPIIDVTKDQVRNAIRTYSDELPKGVYRTIVVNDDYSIDFSKLTHILKGIPSKPFYMSKETYDVFEEFEKDIPAIMDQVQKAVDAYKRDHQQYPIIQYDSHKKVNYYLLRNEHYLHFKPEIDFYITEYDGIISHIKPKKVKGS
jgi:hypothetical protein